MAFYNLDELRSLRILDVCNAFGVHTEKHGSSYFCKLRDEKTASCKLYLDNPSDLDSFYDFGSGVGGDVLKFVSTFLNCDWQNAVEALANAFQIAPVNNIEYFNRNELSNIEYLKIGVYGDLATKNFDFDLEKYSLESVQKYSEKYAMSVNQLRKDYPSKYVYEIIKKRAIPFVYSLRNHYYFSLYCALSLQKSLTGHFDINNIPESELKELKEQCRKLIQAEKLLQKAMRGTDINYSFRYEEYNILSDLKKINFGEISFEIGDQTYSDIKRESTLCGVDLRFRAISVNDYLSMKSDGLNSIPHAAFLKNEKVNLAFLPENSEMIDICIETYQKNKGLDLTEEESSNTKRKIATTNVER